MASEDLDRLCYHLSRMELDLLYTLDDVPRDDQISLVIPWIRGMPMREAVTAIRRNLAAVPDVKMRLRCVARIYCSLMSKGLIGPWVLYRIGDPEELIEDAPLFRFLRAIQFRYDFPYFMKIRKEYTKICVLAPESEAPTASHDVYCLCFWRALARVAVYKPREGYSDKLLHALREMLCGEPDTFKQGEYRDLRSAHEAALL
ncbi:hypothetical protein HPB50_010977 [Hyalomma asiaticum]|uniref:Uncharacterized protein n=1 Tax=Hyalomma asiaticum TaxID=266040 RepID=A0ACB7RQA4_HYAAI|nr:hypothetical protein HPB50_010977 [Hyalomma asiaticum]